MVGGTDDKNLCFWKSFNGSLIKVLKNVHGRDVRYVNFDVNGTILTSCSGDKLVKLWEIVYDRLSESSGYASSVYSGSISGSGLPPELQAEFSFIEPSGNNYLDASEVGTLAIKVGNIGQGIAHNVLLSLTCDFPKELSFPPRSFIGDIEPGEEKLKEISLIAMYKIPSDTVSLICNIIEANGFNLDPQQILFETREYNVELVLAGRDIDDPNDDGMIGTVEVVTVTLRAQNIGTSTAKEVKASIQIGENIFFAGEAPSEKIVIGDLNAGEYYDIPFQIYANKMAPDTLPVFLTISEYYGEFGSENIPLVLAFEKPISSVQQLFVKGKEVEAGFVAEDISIDVELNIPEGVETKKDAVALIIGNRNYEDPDIPDVEFALRDAQFMKQYLINLLGYREGNIIFLKDDTNSQFRTTVQKLENSAKDTSEIFIYYTGHGAPDLEEKRGYFVPVDCDPNYVKVGGVPLEEFYQEINSISAKNIIVIIDACFSESSDQGMIIKNISPVMLEVESEYIVGDNLAEFTSTSGEEVISWYPDKKHSLYTYYFLKVLQGKADKNKDKILTIGEFQAYLIKFVPYKARRLNNRQQTPGITPNRENWVIVQYKEDSNP